MQLSAQDRKGLKEPKNFNFKMWIILDFYEGKKKMSEQPNENEKGKLMNYKNYIISWKDSVKG